MKLGPFARLRRKRRDEQDLGQGLWRHTHDRFQRSLDRYWQIVDLNSTTSISGSHSITQEELNGLVHAGNILTDQLATVRELCVAGHQATLSARGTTGEEDATSEGEPAEGLNVPGELIDMHRWISKASNDLATTAQAVALFRRGQASIDSVGRQAQKVLDAVTQAKESAPHL